MVVAVFDPALVAGQLEARTPWVAGRAQTDPVAYGRFNRLGWIDLIEGFDMSIRLPRPSDILLAQQVQAMLQRPEGRVATIALDLSTAAASVELTAGPATPDPIVVRLDLTALQVRPAIAAAFTEAAATAAGGSHHRVRALINLWRFYTTLEYRCGRLQPRDEDRARTIVFFAQFLLCWPWLLDLLTPSADRRPLLQDLADACEDDSRWQASTDGLHVDSEDLAELRDLLHRCGNGRGLLVELAQHHL